MIPDVARPGQIIRRGSGSMPCDEGQRQLDAYRTTSPRARTARCRPGP
jgi:hypothetical protein